MTTPRTANHRVNYHRTMEDVSEEFVLKYIGDKEVPLGHVLGGVGGTLAKSSKIVTGLIRRGELVLTADRTLYRPTSADIS